MEERIKTGIEQMGQRLRTVEKKMAGSWGLEPQTSTVSRVLVIPAQLTQPTQRNELHLHFPPDRALSVAEAYISRHGSRKELQALPPAIDPEENI